MAAIVILGIFSVALLAASSSTYQMQANNRSPFAVRILLLAAAG